MIITLAAISGALSFANGGFTFGQWVFKLNNVAEDVRTAIEDLASIQKDLNDARELRSLKYDMDSLEKKNDRNYRRLDSAIRKLEVTVKECSKTLQAQAVDRGMMNGGVGILNRFDWILNGKDTFVARQPALTRDHTRLIGVMTALEALPDASPSPELLAPPPYSTAVAKSGDYWDSLSPSQRRAMRGKSTELIDEEDNGENTTSQSMYSCLSSFPDYLTDIL